MDESRVVDMLSALAQETRLQIFRRLVRAGICGLAAGRIGEDLKVPGATLSFHLKEMKHAGIISSRKDGRSVIYSANFSEVSELLDFLMENCCEPTEEETAKPCCPSEDEAIEAAN